MTIQERKTLVNLLTSLVSTAIYGIIMYNRYNSGALSDENLMKFWAIIILILVPVGIVTRIVATILHTIIESIVSEIKGEDPEDLEIVDERDKLIELKAMRVSLVLFSIGFMIALVTQLFNHSGHVFFLTILAFGFVSSMLSEVATILYYRKGV